ncbi:subtilisin-like protein, partial [Trichoderma reesei RUT C-30]
RTRKIRIAIIDTGIDAENDITMQTALAYGSIKSCRGFAGNEEDFQDVHGHGTHIARLMLTVAPAAELYVAKIANEKTLDSSALSRIAEAIKWAHKTMKVDIISLSFGLDSNNRNVEIDKAIFNAISDDTIIFAASANNGGNRPRAYPANRRTGVICIHASDGRGNDGGISPSPEPRKSNFSTLGISIESRWKGKKVLKSGTSFATPIAAAIAANMLEFARYKCSLDEYEHRRLHSYDSIEEVLHLMAEERQGYHYIMPLRMWDGADDTDVAGKLVEI